MANKTSKRAGPQLSSKERVNLLVADLKTTSWLERTVIIFAMILLIQITYFFFFIPGDTDLEIELAQKKAEVASAQLSLNRPSNSKDSNDEIKEDPKDILAAIDMRETERNMYKYDPAGKRDPFLPFGLTTKIEDDSSKTPLERYDLGQLKLTAVLLGMGEPKAIVENASGRGFTVTVGTKIGRNNGVITQIEAEKVVVRERFVNFTGEEQVKDVDLRLRLKGTDDSSQISIR